MWMVVGGGVVLGLLVTVGGYPVSAVGVPGDGRSNLAPPSLVAVALGVAQIGVFLALRKPGRTGAAWARRAVREVNRVGVPVYLWHQSVLLGAVAVFAGRGGLVGVPDGRGWVFERVAWLPVLGVGLAAVAGVRWRTTRWGRIS
nr:hypothetical protein [Actinoplanes consettensis]